MSPARAALLAGAVWLAPVPPASAQVAPRAAEVAAYAGLHAAAHRGDVVRLKALLAAGAPVDGRDTHGRTPLHVATFARQRDAIRTLAAAGAALGALENDRYDAVTIAAVADDEETLRVLLALGASAKQVTERRGKPRLSGWGGRARGMVDWFYVQYHPCRFEPSASSCAPIPAPRVPCAGSLGRAAGCGTGPSANSSGCGRLVRSSRALPRCAAG